MKDLVRHRIATTMWLGACLFYVAIGIASGSRDEGEIEAAARATSGVSAPGVVYVGEAHDRLGHHRMQLAVIRALHARGIAVAIGLEMVQVPFQDVLDDYVAGNIDLTAMLRETEYYSRWQYDARLYRDIFAFAREHGLPLVALNAAREITDRVSAVGIDGLTDEERAQLPDTMEPPQPAYRELLERVYREHAELVESDIERFVAVQQAWDETMAARSAAYLAAHPDHVLVVLAGMQHVANGYGIPSRVEQRTGIRGPVILAASLREMMPDAADAWLDVDEVELPSPGRMGVMIDPSVDGPRVTGFSEDSPAAAAGVESGDRIVAIDGHPVDSFPGVRLALWDKLPGDAVEVEIERERDADASATLRFRLQ